MGFLQKGLRYGWGRAGHSATGSTLTVGITGDTAFTTGVANDTDGTYASAVDAFTADIGGTATGTITYNWSIAASAGSAFTGTASIVGDDADVGFSVEAAGGTQNLNGTLDVTLEVTRGGLTESHTITITLSEA